MIPTLQRPYEVQRLINGEWQVWNVIHKVEITCHKTKEIAKQECKVLNDEYEKIYWPN